MQFPLAVSVLYDAGLSPVYIIKQELITSTKDSRTLFAIALLKHKVYITGGMYGSTEHDSVVVFDLDSQQFLFNDDPLMNVTRYNHSSTALGDSIYIFAG